LRDDAIALCSEERALRVQHVDEWRKAARVAFGRKRESARFIFDQRIERFQIALGVDITCETYFHFLESGEHVLPVSGVHLLGTSVRRSDLGVEATGIENWRERARAQTPDASRITRQITEPEQCRQRHLGV